MTSEERPKISVVIPCYNAAHFLAETLDSVLGQGDCSFEVILVDDGSTDRTSDIARAYGQRIKSYSISHSGGPAKPRNIGVSHAAGDLVAFFDSDDLMRYGKLSNAERIFDTYPNVDLLFTDFQTIDVDGNVMVERFLREYRRFRECLISSPESHLFFADGLAIYRYLLAANFIGTSSVVMRSAVIRETGGFSEDLLNSDDVDLWYRVARAGHRFAYFDQVGHSYRCRGDSISAGGSKRIPAIIEVLKRQLPYVPDSVLRRDLDRRISDAVIGYAWHLRREGAGKEAFVAGAREFARRPSWAVLRSLILSCGPSSWARGD